MTIPEWCRDQAQQYMANRFETVNRDDLALLLERVFSYARAEGAAAEAVDAATLEDKARVFGRCWAAWAVTPAQCPDEDTIEAASALLECLGIEICEPE